VLALRSGKSRWETSDHEIGDRMMLPELNRETYNTTKSRCHDDKQTHDMAVWAPKRRAGMNNNE